MIPNTNIALTDKKPNNTFIIVTIKIRNFLPFVIVLMQVSIPTPLLAGGDPEYGEYLSSECATCHRAKAVDATIPSLNGMDAEGFVQIMKLYRGKQLENPTMQTIAKRLKDEDIEALAAYYSSLPEPE